MERIEGRPAHRRLLVREAPDVGRHVLAQRLHHGRQDGQGQENHGVAAHRDDQHVRPVGQAHRGQLDAQRRAEAPEDEAVDEVDGEDVQEQQHEELEGEELLHQRAQLDDGLEAQGEDQLVQFGHVVLRVSRAGSLGDGTSGCWIGVDVVLVRGVFTSVHCAARSIDSPPSPRTAQKMTKG